MFKLKFHVSWLLCSSSVEKKPKWIKASQIKHVLLADAQHRRVHGKPGLSVHLYRTDSTKEVSHRFRVV